MKSRVVVVGGGYGGALAAKALDEETDVVLVEPREAFFHVAGLLRAVTRPEWAENVFIRYDKLLRNGRIVRERAVSVDTKGVTLASGERLVADYVVLATGSSYPHPAKADTDSVGEAVDLLKATHKELLAADRILLLGAGPVGLELAGEIKAVWPGKHVTIIDPAGELLPGFVPEIRADLHRQLDALGIDVRLGTSLPEEPPTPLGRTQTFAVTASDGSQIEADLWFRCYGLQVNSDYLAADLGDVRTPEGRVRVTEKLNLHGHAHIYAVGDLTDAARHEVGGYTRMQAGVAAENILAQVRGEEPSAVHVPGQARAVLLPLGPEGGVGQIPSPDGPNVLSAQAVSQIKGHDLFVGHFRELLGHAPSE